MDQGSIFDRCPKFHELDLIECNGKLVRVFEKVANKWTKIASRLHFEGDMITQIRTDCQHDTYQSSQTMFTEWLGGKEGLRTPRTWDTVIKVLKEAGLGQLADDLKDVLDLLEKHSVLAQRLKSPITTTASAKALSATPTEGMLPLLKHTVPNIHSEDYEKLETRLYSESVSLTTNFGIMFNNFFQSLSNRCISIKKIITNLKAFGAFSPLYKGENKPLLREELHKDRLNPTTADIDDIKSIILDYCSFFNYRLFSSLVSTLGTENDKIQFKMYEKEFNEYAKRRIFECPSELGKPHSTHAILTVKLDSNYEQCSLNQLKLLEADFCKILNVSSLKLCLVTSGCLQLTFQLPWFVQKEIFPLSQEQEEKLAALYIVHVICGYYHFTAKIHVQEPAEQEQTPIETEESRVQYELPWMVTKEKVIQVGSQTYIQLENEALTTTAASKAPMSTAAEMYRVHEPPHRSAEEQCTISINCSLGGPYEFPENFHLVSAVYWIRCEPQYTIPVTMTIQHCAKQENVHRLSFATATGSQGSLPYTFRCGRGNFSSNISEGEINLESISGKIAIAIIQEGSDDRKYTTIPFYQKQTSYTYEIHLVVTWSTTAHLHAVRDQYKNKGFDCGKEKPVEFESDELKLDVPTEGITLMDGWNITPLTTEAITKAKFHSYEPSKEFQKCCLLATFTKTAQEADIPNLHHHITIIGAREPYNKFVIDIHESGPSPKRHKRSDSELDTELECPSSRHKGD